MTNPNRHFRIVERVASRLKLKQLRLLVAVTEQASILHAAQELNISQPAATKLLKDLEADFGVKLFERSNRGAIPTVYGDVLTRHGKLILSQISHAAQELDDLVEGTGGRVVVGTFLAASADLLPNTIQRIRQDRPNVSIQVREGTKDVLIPALQTGDLDLVVGRLPEFRYRENLIQETLFNERATIVAHPGHPLATAPSVGFPDLLEWDWILPPQETTLRRQIDKVFQDAGYPPPANVVESVSQLTNRKLLMMSDMLSVWPYQVVEEDIQQGRLALIPFDLEDIKGQVGVSYRRAKHLSPAASAFLDALRETAGAIRDRSDAVP